MSVKRRDVAMVSNEYEDYSDSVLYDVFYEAGTMLGGWLSSRQVAALKKGNHALADRYEQERFELDEERSRVGAHDRAAQIAMIKKWHVRRVELDSSELLVAM